MRCLVTAGPTWEPLDRVRRLTNFSTGSLGGQLANHLASNGHDVCLLRGESVTWRNSLSAVSVEDFSTTASLAELFQNHATDKQVAIFHAAAVSDFTCAGVHERDAQDKLTLLRDGKFSTRGGNLWVELCPTPKILPLLRTWFANALIVGWKYETDGTREDVLARVARQFQESRNDLCVANGPAYGDGFGLVTPTGKVTPLPGRTQLFAALAGYLSGQSP
jgi:phosphopantothenoylcysteine decarboxylase/phosphopantothenate--cysteine ligase